jgi:hypothetical protein
MRKKYTNYKHVVLREDGEAVVERTGLEISMLERVRECLRNGLEEINRLHPELTETEILSSLACLADHPAEARGYTGMKVSVRSEETFPLDYDDFPKRCRVFEGYQMLEVYQDDEEDDFSAAA